jgi:hypothetical protein
MLDHNLMPAACELTDTHARRELKCATWWTTSSNFIEAVPRVSKLETPRLI